MLKAINFLDLKSQETFWTRYKNDFSLAFASRKPIEEVVVENNKDDKEFVGSNIQKSDFFVNRIREYMKHEENIKTRSMKELVSIRCLAGRA